MADVTLLYKIIPHTLGLSSVSHYLGKYSDLISSQKSFILNLPKFPVTHNYFWIGGHFYLHCRCVVMGAKYAPSVANLFMAKWEEDVIYARLRPKLSTWACYIDDILLHKQSF